MKKMIVTSALLYANGQIHLGHMVEAIQTDIWVRFHKLFGHECYYLCGNDAHGTPIMLSAEKEGVSPEKLIEKIYASHKRDFKGFHIHFDSFYTTHSEENKQLSLNIYEKLKARGDIVTREITQAYDPEKEMFLPDRYIKGTCPKCGKEDQYGDNCEHCGATYAPTDLVDAYSVVSGAKPVEKTSEHIFFALDNYRDFLQTWYQEANLQPEMVNKLNEWFDAGLKEWNVSRDKPYFGFEIPDMPGKYFYVWLDAPIGYMAITQKLCEDKGLEFDSFWGKNSDTELYHFVGKDIVYFHALFWPAILHGSDYRLPNGVYSHGFLTVNGKKMSKSRGTFIQAQDYLKHCDPEHFRYYIASKLTDGVEDIDFNPEDFRLRINSDLVGKVVNIASRTAGFIHKKFDGMLSKEVSEPPIFQTFVDKEPDIRACYENRQFSQATRHIMELADLANQYIAEKEPWTLAKDEKRLPEVQQICTMGINLFRLLMIYLKPILPKMAEDAEAFLNVETFQWRDLTEPLLNHNIHPFKPLTQRIMPETMDALIKS